MNKLQQLTDLLIKLNSYKTAQVTTSCRDGKYSVSFFIEMRQYVGKPVATLDVALTNALRVCQRKVKKG